MSLWRCGVSSENSTGNGNAMVPWLKRHWVGWLAEWLVIPLIPLIWVELYAAIYMMVMVGLDGNAWCWAKQLSNVWIWQVTHKCWIKTKRDSSSVVGSGELDKARVLGEFFDVFCRDGLVGRDGSKLGTSGPDWTPAPDSTRPCLKCLSNFMQFQHVWFVWRMLAFSRNCYVPSPSCGRKNSVRDSLKSDRASDLPMFHCFKCLLLVGASQLCRWVTHVKTHNFQLGYSMYIYTHMCTQCWNVELIYIHTHIYIYNYM